MLLLSLAFTLSSCGVRRVSMTVTPEGVPITYHYWYYPHDQFYFDRDHNVYYFQEHGDWRQSDHLPSRYSFDSPHVTIDENTDKPYENHKRHMREHPE